LGEEEEETVAKPKNLPQTYYDPHSSVICKGCHQFHYFAQLQLAFEDAVLFPNFDLSLIRVICSENEEYYDYKYEDLFMPVRESSELGKRVKTLEKRLAGLEQRIGLSPSPEEPQRSIVQRIENAENLLVKLLEGQKEEPPKGQHT
jgi:hypothetical protein